MAYVPDEAIETADEITHAAFKLYVCYCRHRNNKQGHPHYGLAWPDRETIHDMTGICTTYVSTLKAELKAKGWLETIGTKVRLLRGYDLPARESNNPTLESNSSTFAQPEKFDSSTNSLDGSTNAPGQGSNGSTKELDYRTKKKNGSTEKFDSSTRLSNKAFEPRKEPSNEPAKEPTPPNPPRAANATAGSAVRATRLPKDFALTDEMRRWATEKVPLVAVELATEEFRDYWLALPPGKRATKVDWLATWKNRLRTLQGEREREERRLEQYAANRRNNSSPRTDYGKPEITRDYSKFPRRAG